MSSSTGASAMTVAKHFKHAELPLIPCKAPGGETRIARVINSEVSQHMGGGLEIMEGVNIHWTVTYDEILYIHEGHMTIRTDQGAFECGPGDIVWLPNGTTLDYDASKGRCAYFYTLYPVDWAARQGTKEP
jgi:ethanolamine utilization protein EutQ (cupin superfamily)